MSARALFFSQPVPFAEAAAWQEQLAEERAREAIPDTVLFLEHLSVVTLGARGRTEHLKVPPEELAERGIDLCRASRGGDVTWHGPGQLVMYPILKLGERATDARGYLINLEEVALRTAADFGVEAWRRKGLNGIWTDAGKLAAIGFRLRRGVTLHGMSFNVDPDLAGFKTIVPCGRYEPVATLQMLLGSRCPSLNAVRERMALQFGEVFHRPLTIIPAQEIVKGLA